MREFDLKNVTSISSLENVIGEFRLAAKHLSLSENQISYLQDPRFSVKLKIPVQLDNGKMEVFKGYHTIHSILRGPSIGGIQFRPNIKQETVDALAFWSTHRCALLGIPFGGSAGAIDCDTSGYSTGEVERLSRRYISELSSLINPNNDILTSDIGTNQQIMCWFMDTNSNHMRKFIPSVVLGKPPDLGGIAYEDLPTAIGAYLCIKKACEYKKLPINKAKVAIQGFGKVGTGIAQLLNNDGANIIGISDITGAYINEKGIDVQEAIWHQQSYGMLDGIDGEIDICRLQDPSELFELPTDILVMAAIELQITENNVSNVKSKIIAEIAHDPISPIADKILYENGTLIIPDILCNSGGVSGHYLEWVQNRMGYYWPAKRVTEEVSAIVNKAIYNTLCIMNKHNTSLRLAAAIIAVDRLAKANNLRGIYA